ncbi:MAG: asparaginyl/glutamyl-tRNA amidotransferase subunit C [Elusimicrobia bacterium GWC2_51_8]|nr:MAG: asparaginyl/glutamyl-tRNA amidotransferase subunit C [Elusimicrobia bacterium GWA2_51_34]OGR62499.1 MAG: asparaginyl/glutamyl-tRNA amidotransferase subunit C [Elusimicrobia bacterium GWC2_51_8]HAF96251.1 Asp-tRNA(Asn)/Glu-tRNA(Gln) amidotransferase subunit GatB [Elusimicrobiota bacterium]HCE97861.1 Asp-tRNA(Asn)/Glu-tRNA(Gln) amidotransferase subunit GatB [Elusimicrobiota bacterium]
MKIEKKDVEYIADLSRLELTGEEKELYSAQLGDILSWMDELNKADTSKVEPTAHILGLENVLRSDLPEPFPDREAILKLAPQRELDFIKVPKVIE